MLKNIFLFPGQGSQEVGMAKDLFAGDEYFKSLIEQASRIAGEDLERLCLRGPELKLMRPQYLQPLIVGASLGYLRNLIKKGITADCIIGHSLGEITALAAAGVISDSLAIDMALKRGQLMDETAAICDGAMMAVLSLTSQAIEGIILEQGLNENITISNDNALDQVVVSGDKYSLSVFSQVVLSFGGRCKKINVSGPWHSPYLNKACQKFGKWVKDIEFNHPHTDIVFNAIARPESDPEKIKELITQQLCKPVYFRQCLEYIKHQEPNNFFEIGPGRVLSGLVRANGLTQGVDIYNINNLRGIDRAAVEIFS